MAELYHPDLKVTVTVSESAVPHMIREGGWEKPQPAKTKKKTSDQENE